MERLYCPKPHASLAVQPIKGRVSPPLHACRVMVMDRLRGVPLTDLDAVRSITTGERRSEVAAPGCSGNDRAQYVTAHTQQHRQGMPAVLQPQLLHPCLSLQWSPSWCSSTRSTPGLAVWWAARPSMRVRAVACCGLLWSAVVCWVRCQACMCQP